MNPTQYNPYHQEFKMTVILYIYVYVRKDYFVIYLCIIAYFYC